MKIGTSDIVEAFDRVGTRVLDKVKFMALLEQAVAAHDASKDQQPGQHFVRLPASALEFVSAGIGKHTGKPEDYVVRMWRGEVDLFLKREFAEPATGVACVVYTRDAYLKDPEVDKFRFAQAFPTEDTTHCIVAVLAFAGPKPPVGPARFVSNFAGANNEYDMLHRAAEMADKNISSGAGNVMNRAALYGVYLEAEALRLKKLAGESIEYSRTWCVVAD